ncbi:MAG TPA: transposase [Thermoplasmata archaeon]|nr:transposase [Thermoplasmata archaeon]
MAVKKVHLGKSCSRARGLMQVGCSAGNTIMGRVPNYAIPSRVFNMPAIEELFVDLIQRSALPLKDLEDGGTVAIDSSGFCTTCRGAYCTETHNPTRKHRFLKAHVVIGVKTHIILNVAITDESGADHPQFIPLLQGMKEAGFNPAIVVADKAYPSRANYQAADEMGMEAYLPFRSNTTGSTIGALSRGSQIYRKMLLMFQLHREDFDKKYHARSNVEAVFSAVKRKLGEALSSKNSEARLNELLAKLLAYNITVLIHEMFEHGIDPGSVGLPQDTPKSRPSRKAPQKLKPRPDRVAGPRPDILSMAIHKLQPAARDSIPAPVINFDSKVGGA